MQKSVKIILAVIGAIVAIAGIAAATYFIINKFFSGCECSDDEFDCFDCDCDDCDGCELNMTEDDIDDDDTEEGK